MEKKNFEIRVKFSRQELLKVKAKAAKLGLPVSAYLRLMGLNAHINPIKADISDY